MSHASPSTTDRSDTTTRRPVSLLPSDRPIAPGTEIAGRYWVIAAVGSGAMGRVYRAYDPRLGREVALKRLRIESPDAEKRLAREARAMAQLNHPNVVGVYDVAADATGLTIAMEYVPGSTLATWRQQSRSLDAVVEAFVAAGRGLAAAHAAGFVHRDFKPANVLVTDDGRVKVTDFGVARSVRASPGSQDDALPSSEASEPDVLTQLGTVIGSPRYMSPEQHRAVPADARSDQYNFCVSLWEALVGEPPFPGPSAELAAQKEDGPPPWPRTTTLPAAMVAALVRGLSVQPIQRWPSMDALLAEISAARAPRRRARWLGGGAAAAAATAAIVWTTQRPSPCQSAPTIEGWDTSTMADIGTRIRQTELPFADRAAGQLSERLDQYAQAWAAAAQDNCEATLVSAKQSMPMMDRATLCLLRSQTYFTAAVATVQSQAQRGEIDRLGDVVGQLPSPSRCRDPQWLMAVVPPPADADQADAVRALQAELAFVEAAIAVGNVDSATQRLSQIESRLVATGYEPTTAAARVLRGKAERTAGRSTDAVQPLRQGYMRALAAGDFAMAADAARELGLVLGHDLVQAEEGVLLIETALALVQRPGADPKQAIAARSARGVVLSDLGRQLEALTDLRTAYTEANATLSPNDAAWTTAATALGVGLYDNGHNSQAAALHQTILDRTVEQVGRAHPATVLPRINLAVALDGLGRVPEAIEQLEAARKIAATTFGPQHPRVALCDLNLGVVRANAGEHEAAEQAATQGLAKYRALYGEAHQAVARGHGTLGYILAAADRLQDSEAAYDKAVAASEATAGPLAPQTLIYRLRRARLVLRNDRPEEAQAELRPLIEAMQQTLPSNHADFGLAWESLGEALLACERADEAVAAFGKALQVIDRGQLRPAAPAILRYKLALALHASGDQQSARATATAARDALAVAPGTYERDQKLLDEIDAWLAEVSAGP